ncbi:MAG: winged helix-turn-helix transcriptional regulator, partial [Gemmatimonadota bacterium]
MSSEKETRSYGGRNSNGSCPISADGEPSSRKHEAQYLRALAHPTRLRILELLSGGDMCGRDLEPYLGLEGSTVAHHLHVLQRVGILAAHKNGTRVVYQVRDMGVLMVCRYVSNLIARQAEDGPGHMT